VKKSAFLALLLAALPAGAPPPISPFPAALAPEGSAAPNARIWAFGEGAPTPEEAGFAVNTAGAPVEGALASIGAGLVFTPSAPLDDGALVSVLVSSAGGELSATFTVGGPADETPPTLDVAEVIDAPRVTLIIGVEGTDDVGLAGFLAKDGDAVTSAAPPGFVLQAAADDEGCADVVAVDLAGNESEPARVCAPVAPDGGDPPIEPPGCPGCAGDPSAALLLAPLLLWRRRP
jgi:hypothetical protein